MVVAHYLFPPLFLMESSRTDFEPTLTAYFGEQNLSELTDGSRQLRRHSLFKIQVDDLEGEFFVEAKEI